MKPFKIFIFGLGIIFLFNFYLAAAQAKELKPDLKIQIGSTALSFEPVGPCEGGASSSYCIGWISQYIGVVYRYGVGLAAVLASVMIMVGGFLWLSSAGNPSQITKGKDFIMSALTGLILALFSFLILQTINPRLVALEEISVTTPSYTDVGENVIIGAVAGAVAGGAGVAGTGGTESAGSEQEVRDELADLGVRINHSNPCTGGQTQGCTSVANMPQETIDSLGELAKKVPLDKNGNTQVIVTGGTEDGHQSHGEGLPPVDLSLTDGMVDYVETNGNCCDGNIKYGEGWRVGNDLFVEEANPPHYHHIPNYYINI